MSEKIPWGLKFAVPKDATLAWGARTIYRDGYIDVVHDRQGFIGPDEKSIKEFAILVQDALAIVKKRVLGKFESGDRDIDPGFSEEHILYDSEDLRIVGNTNASHGYLYLAAWKKVER